MRRVVSLWLPRFATDRWRRSRTRGPERRPSCASPASPLALVEAGHGRLVLAALDAAAERAGLSPGLPLAAARALVPELGTAPHDPAGDAAALVRLAEWCGRYTPWTAADRCGCEAAGAAGILLDVTGCAHLFGAGGEDGEGGPGGAGAAGDEAALLADLTGRLARLGFAARAGLADTPGAAWALARFGAPGAGGADPRWTVAPPGGQRAALAPLPPAALRLGPAAVELLARLGLRRIGDLLELPPATLAPRFGPQLARRLAQALGEEAEAISPRQPPPPHRARLAFAEPIVAPGAVAGALERLLAALARRLEADRRGARRLELVAYRVDGTLCRLGLGTSQPSRDPTHLARLFAERLERIDPGFGIEAMALAAPATEPLGARQLALAGDGAGPARELGVLVDRLAGRLGPQSVLRPAPRESRLPERAVRPAPALEAGAGWPAASACPRPPRLLPRPEPVEAVALLPDHPPVRFRWRRLRHRVVRAEGPERLEPEWWRGDGEEPARDYFRVEDEDGRRYWLYRAAGRWFLHGVFA